MNNDKEYSINSIQRILDNTNSTVTSLSELKNKLEIEQRSNLISNTLKNIVDLYNYEAINLNIRLGGNNYIQHIIPKIDFGRRLGHTYGAIEYAINSGKKILYVVPQSTMVSEIAGWVGETHKNNLPFVFGDITVTTSFYLPNITGTFDLVIGDTTFCLDEEHKSKLYSYIHMCPIILIGTS